MSVKFFSALTLAGAMSANAAIECVAHRGYWSDTVPENTVEAIRRAYNCGANWVETDFNLEADGRMLCYHDPKTRDRVIKPPFHVPTIEEVFAVVPKDRAIQCEIKTYGEDYAAKFDAAVKAAGLCETNIIVSSFNTKALADFKKRLPQYRTLWLNIAKKSIKIEDMIAEAKELGVFSICPGCESAQRANWGTREADAVRAAGFSFRLFGVNSAKSLRYAAELKADAFTCNFFDTCFDWAKKEKIELNAKAAKTIDLTAAFPSSIRTIGIVMPASIQPVSDFKRCLAALEKAGYKMKKAPRMDFVNRASAADRAKDFEEMWLDPEVDLVLCARGGTGAEEILPLLDWNKLRTRNQRVLGFSNITMILNAMLKEKAGHPFSGSTMSHFRYCNVPTLTWLNHAIAGESHPAQKLRVLKAGECKGMPCGGHISLVHTGVNSSWAADTTGRIVFLECVHRSPEQVRKHLDAIIDAGYFKNAAGVVFGDISATGDDKKAAKVEVEKIKHDFAAKMSCPVFDGYNYGHVPQSFAIDFSREISISADGMMTF